MADGNGGNGEGTEGRCCGRLIAKMHQPHGHSGHDFGWCWKIRWQLFSLDDVARIHIYIYIYTVTVCMYIYST